MIPHVWEKVYVRTCSTVHGRITSLVQSCICEYAIRLSSMTFTLPPPPPRYDPAINQWCQVSSMTTKRLGVAVAVLEGQLYAVGGSDGNTPLSTVER